jgi:predicted O-methyltransferase YrrM
MRRRSEAGPSPRRPRPPSTGPSGGPAPGGRSVDLADVERAATHDLGRDPYRAIRAATATHRAEHGCTAYPFSDGRTLTAVARAAGAARVLELGTALGYTACCWAGSGAVVDTVEGDPTHADHAEANVSRMGLSRRVTVHRGDFADVVRRLDGPYDIVFFDGNAPDLDLLEAMRERLAPSGLLVTTNLHFAGERVRRHLATLHGGETVFLDPDTALTLVR